MNASEAPGPWVLDTTVLSNFARIARPDLLRTAIGEKGAWTVVVKAELEAGERSGRIPSHDWTWLPLIELTTREASLVEELSGPAGPLGRGEASCIAVATIRQATVVTDDQAARRYTSRTNVGLMGTLTTLLILVERGSLTLDEADVILLAMIERGYRSPISSLKQLYS